MSFRNFTLVIKQKRRNVGIIVSQHLFDIAKYITIAKCLHRKNDISLLIAMFRCLPKVLYGKICTLKITLRKVAGSLEFYGKFLEFSEILLEFFENFA